MKRTILIMATTCGLCTAYGQKGSVLVFGNVTGNTGRNTDPANANRTFNLLVNAGIGYQLSKHITVGPQGGYMAATSKTTRPTTGPVRTYSYDMGVGAFGRYTAYISPAIFAYLQADAGYNQAGTKGVTPAPRMGADLFAGVGAFVYRHWAININVGGINYRRYSSGGVTQSSTNFDLGSRFQFGISKNFVRHGKAKVGEEKS